MIEARNCGDESALIDSDAKLARAKDIEIVEIPPGMFARLSPIISPYHINAEEADRVVVPLEEPQSQTAPQPLTPSKNHNQVNKSKEEMERGKRGRKGI